MSDEKKSIDRRPIGPAMQWAKTRAGSERHEARRQQRIDIQLDIENARDPELDRTSSANQHGDGGSIPRRRGTSQNRMNAPSRDVSSARDRRNEYNFEDDVDTSSAWDYYAGDASKGQVAGHQNRGSSSQQPNWYRHGDYSATGSSPNEDRPHFNDVGYEYPHQVQAANYNSRSTDLNSTTDMQRNDGPGLRQYLLPILVVAVIIIVGLLGSQA